MELPKVIYSFQAITNHYQKFMTQHHLQVHKLLMPSKIDIFSLKKP